LIALNNAGLESLLNKAKEYEKKYEWLQAADCYNEATDLITESEDFSKLSELYEKNGFCFFKAAFQSETNNQFKKRLEKAIKRYEKIITLSQSNPTAINSIQVDNSEAMIAYANSWFEYDAIKTREFLDKWWILKHKVLNAYEKQDNQLGIAKTCNDILKGSVDCKYFLSTNWKESNQLRSELISLGEKAIRILGETEEDYELACALCWTSWYCIMTNSSSFTGQQNKELMQKGSEFAEKALNIALRTGDAWLIGWCYNSISQAPWTKGDLNSAIAFINKSIEQGEIVKDNYLSGLGRFYLLSYYVLMGLVEEDPDKIRELYRNDFLLIGEKVLNQFKIINLRIWNAYYPITQAYYLLSDIEPDVNKKYILLEKAVENGKKSVELVQGWVHTTVPVIIGLYSIVLFRLSEFEPNSTVKREIFEEMLNNVKRMESVQEGFAYNFPLKANIRYYFAIAKVGLSRISQEKSEKISLLNEATVSIESCITFIKNTLEGIEKSWLQGIYANYYYSFGEIYSQHYFLTKKKDLLTKSMECYTEATILFEKLGLMTRVAESNWQQAKIQDQIGEYFISSKYYISASEAYSKAVEKIPQLKDFYRDYSVYMQAWSQIEQARHCHSIEDYEEAKQNYEKTAKLHKTTSLWSYLTPNYSAWAYMEEAEGLSRKENTQLSKQTFQKAYEQFCSVEESLGQKIEEITSSEEKKMAKSLFEASDLRRKYCQARIHIEEAKLLDREGNYLESSKKYGKAAQNISTIVENIDVEAERKELEYVAILCQAWEKMAVAEEATSSKSYLEAAELFEEAKDYCYTSKASLWALGNSNFCRGLAAGADYQTNLDLGEHAKAKSFMKSASTHYEKAGFKAASEYAKATLRLFDAYAFMNQAENELDQEKRAKQYQMAENLLQIAADSFMKAKQPEKTTQVQRILANVREEKALAISLSQVMKAPAIASTTMSFTAPTPTSEVSVGLEKFEHANIQANLVTTVEQVKVGESFCLSVEFVNAGREPALLMKVDDFVPSDFVVVKKPEIYRIEETTLNMKGKQITPLKLVEVKLTLQPSKKGDYQLNPRVQYLDERGQSKTVQLKTLEIKVEEVILEDRVTTGTEELDSLLLGGIPEQYAVVLSSSPCDERELIVNNFLKAGIKEGISFYVTTEAKELQDLLKNPNFFLFLCNPKPKVDVPDSPNVFKLQDKTDLTNLGIALVKAQRSINQSVTNKRICIEILSDVLVKHRENTTREWISGLITDLGAKGFTMLVVMNPSMHLPNEANAVLDLFDGEISITQSDDPLDCKKLILVKKLRNQDYIKNPICLR